MEYGSRLSRLNLGVDFRSLLVPIFERHILRAFREGIDRCCASGGLFDTACELHVWTLSKGEQNRMGVRAPEPHATHAPLQPMMAALLSFPPLALLADGLLALVNELTKCAPRSLARSVGRALHHGIGACIQRIKNIQLLAGATAGSAIGAKPLLAHRKQSVLPTQMPRRVSLRCSHSRTASVTYSCPSSRRSSRAYTPMIQVRVNCDAAANVRALALVLCAEWLRIGPSLLLSPLAARLSSSRAE
jgi:hypothetical protein